MSDRIDSHNHFWRYRADEYGWIGDGMNMLRGDFLPSDLLLNLHAAGIDGTIAVQARQTMQETEWLLQLSAAHDFVRGVVGWVPLSDPGVKGVLERVCEHRQLKGVRHVVQDEPDDEFMLRANFNNGIQQLQSFGLVYDILIFERHLPQTLQFVDRHPGQIFVIDHLAKPRIRSNELSPWRERIVELARRDNVYCKISGMVTEASWTEWKPEDLKPYFDTVLTAFGPRRLMFGSDWPVMLVASSYALWADSVRTFISHVSSAEQDWIMGGTAIQVYKLANRTYPSQVQRVT
jgi:L-fuconolactonase